MAVTKLWKVENNLKKVLNYTKNPDKTRKLKYSLEDIQSLKNVLAYAKDEEKKEQEFYVSGINCNPNKACQQYIDVKTQFGKTDGIQAYHGYMSFKDTDNVTPELAHQIGMEFARRVWGDRFQIVVTTHLNTKCLHCHFVINSVSFSDGKMMHGKEKAWFYFRHIADEVCKDITCLLLKILIETDRRILLLCRTETMKVSRQGIISFVMRLTKLSQTALQCLSSNTIFPKWDTVIKSVRI